MKILHRSVVVLVLMACFTLAPATLVHAAPSYLTPNDAPPVSQEVVENDTAPGWLEVVLNRLVNLFGIDVELDASTDDGSCPPAGSTEHGGGMDTDG